MIKIIDFIFLQQEYYKIKTNLNIIKTNNYN